MTSDWSFEVAYIDAKHLLSFKLILEVVVIFVEKGTFQGYCSNRLQKPN